MDSTKVFNGLDSILDTTYEDDITTQLQLIEHALTMKIEPIEHDLICNLITLNALEGFSNEQTKDLTNKLTKITEYQRYILTELYNLKG